MVFEVLAGLALLGAFWHARRHRAWFDPDLLPPQDRPPLEAWEPMPPRTRLRRYVGDGLADLDEWLAGRDRDQTA